MKQRSLTGKASLGISIYHVVEMGHSVVFFWGTTFVFSISDDQYREKSVAGLARGVGCLHPNNFSMKFFP